MAGTRNKTLHTMHMQCLYLTIFLGWGSMILHFFSVFCVDGQRASLQAMLSGCSAGGLASIIHCDNFRSQLPEKATVKCLSDAGFFLDTYVLERTLAV